MNRRHFLSLFSAGVAGIALEQAIPLGRVWSFPKEIVIPEMSFMGFDPAFGDDMTVVRRAILKAGEAVRWSKCRQRWTTLPENYPNIHYCGLPPG
jgi:hypothetical protein